jgi:hypothetical protein
MLLVFAVFGNGNDVIRTRQFAYLMVNLNYNFLVVDQTGAGMKCKGQRGSVGSTLRDVRIVPHWAFTNPTTKFMNFNIFNPILRFKLSQT